MPITAFGLSATTQHNLNATSPCGQFSMPKSSNVKPVPNNPFPTTTKKRAEIPPSFFCPSGTTIYLSTAQKISANCDIRSAHHHPLPIDPPNPIPPWLALPLNLPKYWVRIAIQPYSPQYPYPPAPSASVRKK